MLIFFFFPFLLLFCHFFHSSREKEKLKNIGEKEITPLED